MSAQAIIDELLEYFEDRADASMEPGEDRFHSNREMALLQEVQKLEKYISEASIRIETLENENANLHQLLSDYMEDYDCLNWLALHTQSARDRRNASRTRVSWMASGDENRKRRIREVVKIEMEREEELK